MRMLSASEAPDAGTRTRRATTWCWSTSRRTRPRGSNPALTVYETLDAGSPNDMVPAIRNILGGFLFSGDDIYKKAGVLSGGERTRLAVARMLLRPSNTLLLDEPTNHLDLDSKDVLLEALEDYGGTLILVSHDRYFVERLATKIIEIGHGGARRLSRHLHRVSVEQEGARGAGRRRRGRTAAAESPPRRNPTAGRHRGRLGLRAHGSGRGSSLRAPGSGKNAGKGSNRHGAAGSRRTEAPGSGAQEEAAGAGGAAQAHRRPRGADLVDRGRGEAARGRDVGSGVLRGFRAIEAGDRSPSSADVGSRRPDGAVGGVAEPRSGAGIRTVSGPRDASPTHLPSSLARSLSAQW